jgi:hypothetical protein
MALSAAWNRVNKANEFLSLKVAASTTIYKGAMVMVVKGTGYAVPAADTANGQVMGVALETIDNSTGSNGDKSVKVQTNDSWIITLTGVTDADVGKLVYVSDDDTVVKSGQSNDVVAGRVTQKYGTNKAWVRIGDPKAFPDQQAHVADPAACDAMTAVDPDALTATSIAAADATTPGTGADATTPSGAEYTTCATLANELKTDYDALLVDVTSIRTQLVAGVVDWTALKTNVDALNTTIDAILVVLETAGLVATS